MTEGSARQASVAIAAYSPRSVSAAAAAFAREVVAAAAPSSPARAKAWLFAAGRLAAFAERVGVVFEPVVLLSPAMVERFVVEGCRELRPASVRTVRTNLRALARAVERYPEPSGLPLARERAKAPYSPADDRGVSAAGGRAAD